MFYETSLHHCDHLLFTEDKESSRQISKDQFPPDVSIVIEVVDGEAEVQLFINCTFSRHWTKTTHKYLTFEEDIETNDPFISGDVPVIIGVEVLEYPVHENVVGHVKATVEELPEQFPVHPIHLGPLAGVLEDPYQKSLIVTSPLTTVSL